MLFNKLRRRQSGSLPSSHPPTSYIHHASTPPDWPTTPTQATPDVYITSPPEEESGLQTSVCVHRAVENEPKKLKKRDSLPVESLDSQSTPVFKRSSTPVADVIMPKKASDFGAGREGSSKKSGILNHSPQPQPELPAQEQADPDLVGVEATAATAHVQWEGGHQLTRVSSSRDLPIADESAQAVAARKHKDTLRRRASQLFKTFTNRESSHEKRQEARPNGRRNTLSDGSRPFSIWTKAATAHAIPTATVDDSVVTSPKTSGEGRRRSSTIAGGERPVLASPPLPPLPVAPQAAEAKELPIVPGAPISPLEPTVEIAEPAASSASQKSKKLQKKRSKNTFSHLFNLKGGEKQHLRSPPPAKQEDGPVPPVPTIPQELAKAVADPDTPEVPQTPALPMTPKSTKSKRLLRRRRATIDSISHSPNGTPSSLSTDAQTPKTPSSLRSRPFSIIDLRKGFSMRSLGRSKSKTSPSSPAPVPVPADKPKEDAQAPATVMQRYKGSRPPPLQSTDALQGQGAATNYIMSPTAVEFSEVADAVETALSSPTESEGPVTPMFGSQPATALAPAIQLDGPKPQEEETTAPELTFTPPTSEEDGQQSEASRTSEATLAVDDPLFGALDRPSTIGDLDLQLHEPSTKTSTLDAHLKLDSLRFENFSFDADVF
ncbi:hypothetical protein RhiJN_14082 [Ceratobasidium sp. AG-Ba]|nr:hypothetical protein RhiJN_14082 [Ceratobasidium sp. AG-Ba]QRW14634.1 hypothetical protein RhiLY_13633 [Ceratobasidium sp. AG-Ba]